MKDQKASQPKEAVKSNDLPHVLLRASVATLELL